MGSVAAGEISRSGPLALALPDLSLLPPSTRETEVRRGVPQEAIAVRPPSGGGGGGGLVVAPQRDNASLDDLGANCTHELIARRREGCGGGAYSGHLEGMEPGEELLVRSNCKRWDCEYCAELKAERYLKGIIRVCKEHDLALFVSLTLDPKKVSGDPIVYLNRVWHRFIERMRRRHGRGLQYVRVIEFQRNGNPHIHTMLPRGVDHAWVKLEVRKAWEGTGGGAQVDAVVTSVRNVAAYMTKALGSYLVKELRTVTRYERAFRRVTSSIGLRLSRSKVVGQWVRYTTDIMELLRWRVDVGGVVASTVDAAGEVCRALVKLPHARAPGEDVLSVGAMEDCYA